MNNTEKTIKSLEEELSKDLKFNHSQMKIKTIGFVKKTYVSIFYIMAFMFGIMSVMSPALSNEHLLFSSLILLLSSPVSFLFFPFIFSDFEALFKKEKQKDVESLTKNRLLYPILIIFCSLFLSSLFTSFMFFSLKMFSLSFFKIDLMSTLSLFNYFGFAFLAYVFCILYFSHIEKKINYGINSVKMINGFSKNIIKKNKNIEELTVLISSSEQMNMTLSSKFIRKQRLKCLNNVGCKNMDDYITKNHTNKNFILNV